MDENAPDNRRIVEQAYAGLASGDLNAFLATLAPQIEWSEAADTALFNEALGTPLPALAA